LKSSIGQFYAAISEAFEYLNNDADVDLFCGHCDKQILPDTWYYGSGKVVGVNNLESAKLAIEEITEQGEGLSDSIFDGDHRLFGQQAEIAHYFRFNEIHCGQHYAQNDSPESGPSGPELLVEWDHVFNMDPNPKISDYSDQPEIKTLMHNFNCTYMAMLELINDAFNGKQSSLMEATTKMYELKYQATSLMKIPSGKDGTTVGPSFEYVPEDKRKHS